MRAIYILPVLIVIALAFLFPREQYEIISNPIVVSQSNQVLDFKDRKIRLADGSNCPMIVIGSLEEEPTTMLENIIIENLYLDGNKQGQDYEIWHNRENYIRNNGISIRHCRNVTIRKSTIINARSGNIVIEKGCANIIIEDCVLSGAFFDGIAGYLSKDCLIRNNTITGNHYAGLSFDIHFDGAIIQNNIIMSNTLGVFQRDSDDNEFIGNFLENKEWDFYLNQVDQLTDTLPRNNHFHANTSFRDFIRQQ